MQDRTFYRHLLIVYLTVAGGCAVAVWFLNDWFHTALLDMLALGSAQAHVIGTLLMITTAFVAQRLVARLYYGDQLYGIRGQLDDWRRRAEQAEHGRAQVVTELQQVAAYNEILRRQLGATVAATENAANDIAARLQTIDGVVTEMSTYIDAEASASNELRTGSESRIDDNRARILEIDRYFRERIDQSAVDQQRVEQVVEEIRTLEPLVQLVRDISRQTNLLALNAAIEAARAGEVGRGFAVVADQVRKLSSDTDAAVNRIEHCIEAVSASIQSRFAHVLDRGHLDAERATLGDMTRQLDALCADYRNLADHDGNVMMQLQRSSQELTAMFMDAMASIQFQDTARQQIEQVAAALSNLDAHIEQLLQHLDGPGCDRTELIPLCRKIDNMLNSYVMDAQRASHHSALVPHSPALSTAGPRVELF